MESQGQQPQGLATITPTSGVFTLRREVPRQRRGIKGCEEEEIGEGQLLLLLPSLSLRATSIEQSSFLRRVPGVELSVPSHLMVEDV